jgi:leader peptidase (prepilin peptidase)/N-methyltransferase
VCIYRLPLEKSVLWPGSRCGNCLQPIRWTDNIPLLSYWLLGGRCRDCGVHFSIQYFLVELLTGLGYAGLFYLVVIDNVHGFGLLERHAADLEWGVIPWQAWVIYAHHVVLFSFFLVAAACDFQERAIPLGLTVFGTFVGLVQAVLWPWPWPWTTAEAFRKVAIPLDEPWWQQFPGRTIEIGLYPWPVWGPLPDWLPPGSWQLGLVTGLVGALAGTLMVRGIRFLFSTGIGAEALGLGDADLMMMAGAFLGWQLVVIAFFVGAVLGLFHGIYQLLRQGDRYMVFGPWLAAGCMITWLIWSGLGPQVQVLLFNWWLMGALVVLCALIMLISGFVIRLLRRLRGVAEG